jgi:Tat protein secretion system quality control protein TatD with DNase activity
LLPETDAPDQAPSAELDLYPTAGYPAPPINHPGNIKMVYAGLCELLAIKQDELARCVEENFTRLFGVALP